MQIANAPHVTVTAKVFAKDVRILTTTLAKVSYRAWLPP
jgi:hypothetical protein